MKTVKLHPLLKSVSAKVSIPGSKSYTNRALLIAALSKTSVKIINPLISDDTKAMVSCLKKMKNRTGSICKLDANLSGTTLRFLLALSAVSKGTQILYGKEGLNKRPVADLVDSLIQMGAKIEYLDKKGFPPVKVLEAKLNPGIIKISGSLSSQFISALLMIAPLIGEVTIEVTGKQISKPYIDMTIDIMKEFGVKVANNNYKQYKIAAGQKYHAEKYVIEGDLSSASYFSAIAALTKSTITLENINHASKQADKGFLKILENMGNNIISGKNQITVQGKNIKPVAVDMSDCPDQIQTLAVLACFAKGVTKISGISSLRIKETDRVFALGQELNKMGVKTTVSKNILTIYGGNPKAAYIKTYGDHRMAMSFAVAGMKLYGMEITDPDVVNKTFPDFWKILNTLTRNIVLIGLRGSGKTTVSKILAKKLSLNLIETDEMIVNKTKLPISEIVKKYGWDKFRKLENEIIRDIADQYHAVISTGGGIVLNRKNTELLKRNGIIIWLKSKASTLTERTNGDTKRPKLTNKLTPEEEIEEILRQREGLYRGAADEIIETDDINPDEAANILISKLQALIVCKIIGDPVKHSLSPKMHNTAYKALSIDNQFVYVAEKVTKNNLEYFMKRVKTSSIKGISVTVPHKESVIKYLDCLDQAAKNIGAVNTIVNNNGKLTGYNTDWIGAVHALEQKTDFRHKKAAIIGAGGTARAIVYALTKKGAEVKILNRTKNKARKLAEYFGCKYSDLSCLSELKEMDIIINTTPIGMNENKSLINKEFIDKKHVIFDVVYSPKETMLIKDAKEKGAQIIYGHEMLLYQGVAQFELFTEMKAPVEIMRKSLENL